MTVDRIALMNVVKKAMPGVESSALILEGSDTLVFDDNMIHSYNDHISVSVPYELKNEKGKPVEGAINAKAFYDLVNRFSTTEVEIIPGEKSWTLKSGRASAQLTLQAEVSLERVRKIFPKDSKWTKIPTRFFEGLSICRFSANHSPISGVFVTEDKMVSSDSMRVNWYALDAKMDGPFWINEGAVSELLRLDQPKRYALSKSWIHFMTGDAVMFSCKRLHHENYPFDKMESLVSMNKKSSKDVSNDLPAKLIDAIDRAAALSMSIEDYNTIRLTFSKGGIEVFSERPQGRYSEMVKWETKTELGADISIFVDYAMIMNGMRKSKTFYLKKYDEQMGKEKKSRTNVVFVNSHGVQLISTFSEK